MSAAVYTYMFHRPIPTNFEVSQCSSRFPTFHKPIHLQNDTKFDPSCHRLNSLKHPILTPSTQVLRFGIKPKVLG